MHLVHPLREVRAALQRSIHLSRAHGLVLRQVLGVLPLEELDAILGDRLTAEVAVSRRLLVFRLTQSQGLSDGYQAGSRIRSSAPCRAPPKSAQVNFRIGISDISYRSLIMMAFLEPLPW